MLSRSAGSSIDRLSPLFDNPELPVTLHRFPPLTRQTNARGEAKLAVRVLAGHSAVEQTPILRVEVVGEEWDPLFLYLVEISHESFEELKEEQSLRVDFTGFSAQMVRLLDKCGQENLHLGLTNHHAARASSPSGEATASGDMTSISLTVYEITAFRDISHLSLKLFKATEVQTKQYLWERLRQENKRSYQFQERFDSGQEVLRQSQEKNQDLQHQLEVLSSHVKTEREEMADNIAKAKQQALREARLLINEEDHQAKERMAKQVLEMESRVSLLEKELDRERTLRGEAEAESLRNSGAFDALGPLRTEATELRQRVHEYETRAFDESSKSARLDESIKSLESQIRLKQDALEKTEALLQAERDRASHFEQDLRALQAVSEKTSLEVLGSEKLGKQLEERLEQSQGEVEALKAKIETKNLVIREQERVVKSTQNDLVQARSNVRDMEQNWNLEKTKTAELRMNIQETKQRLEESMKLLEENASVITYLNKELSAANLGRRTYTKEKSTFT